MSRHRSSSRSTPAIPAAFPRWPRLRAWAVRSVLMMAALALALVLAWPWPAVGQGRSPADAPSVLEAVQVWLDGWTTMQAGFELRNRHRLTGLETRWSGRLWAERPDRVRVEFDRPRGPIVVAAGGRWTTVDETPDAATAWSEDARAPGIAWAFEVLSGRVRLGDAVVARGLDARASGFSGDVIEVRPRSPEVRLERVLLYVDARPSRRGLIHRALSVDPAGNTTRVDLLEVQVNRRLPPGLFVPHVPAGALRVAP